MSAAIGGTAVTGPQRGFPFQRSVLGEGSREEINLALTTDAAALKAIQNDAPFPLGIDGSLPLGKIQFDWNSAGPVRFAAPGEGNLDLEVGVGGGTGAGVYRDPAKAFEAAGLVGGFKLPPFGERQFLVLTAGYKVSGTLSPSYPIGPVLTAGVNWSGSRQGTTAVIRQISTSTGAASALRNATETWRLPRQIGKATDLPPGTWVAARGSGSLSVQLMARAGYTVSLLKELSLLSTSHALNARLAAALTATVGLALNEDYLIVAGRETDAPLVRLRIYRAAKQTRSAGIDLSVGLKVGKPTTRAGTFVNLTLGIHGLQILSDLQALRNWKSGTGMLSQTPARLDDETALELLTAASGSDAYKNFEEARDRTIAALDLWSAIPNKIRAALWESLENITGNSTLLPFLKKLAQADAAGAAVAISEALAADPGQQSPELLWLLSNTESGSVAPLLEDADGLREPAASSVKVLEDGILWRLRKFIEEKLDLRPITEAGQPDPNKINKWLLARLGDFLDRPIELGDLAELKLAIAGLQKVEPEVFSKAQSAFAELFRIGAAATLENSTGTSALLDADFNLEESQAAQAFRSLMDKGDFNRLVTEPVPGVTLHYATLTHELARTANIQLHLPFFNSKRERANKTVARLQIEESAGRVLAYEVDSKDRAFASGRFRSELALLSRATVQDGKLDLSGLHDGTLAYVSRQIQRSASLIDLKLRTQAFLREQIGGNFSDDEALAALYKNVEKRAVVENWRNLGDVALQFDVALPGSSLEGWLRQRTASERKQAALALSKALQARLKALVPQLYLSGDDQSHLEPNDTLAPLLVWSAIPPSTSILFSNNAIQKWDTGSDVYWDYADRNLRNAVIRDRRTVSALQVRMAQLGERWQSMGDGAKADFFAPGQVGKILGQATVRPGSDLLESLLFTEARMVHGAQEALNSLKDAWKNAASAPSKTLRALSEFGANLSATFNRKLTVFSSPETLRTFNSFLLTEASAALTPEIDKGERTAALTLFFLREGHQIKAEEFLNGNVPSPEDTRFARVLVNS